LIFLLTVLRIIEIARDFEITWGKSRRVHHTSVLAGEEVGIVGVEFGGICAENEEVGQCRLGLESKFVEDCRRREHRASVHANRSGPLCILKDYGEDYGSR
jgi:hypothetical protein